jgi:hypothetical protein
LSDERVKRPPLERVKPVRTWNGLLRRPQAAGSQPPDAAARVEDVVARSVELGYRVVDDYIKRGQEAARRIRAGAYGPGEIAEDVQGVAGQLVRSASDLAGAWVEFAALAAAGAGTVAGGGAAAAAPTSAPAGRATMPNPDAADAATVEPLRVRLCVAAERPIEASLDFRPVPATHQLVVYPLRMDADTTVQIDQVRVEIRDDRTVVIRVEVPATQAAGRYAGLVVDDTTNVPVGEVSLVVPPAG